MDDEVLTQIIFGIVATILAGVAIYLTYKYGRSELHSCIPYCCPDSLT